jgi:hypothetical protein
LSQARERGIRESRFDLLVFVDDDNWLHPDYLRIAREISDLHPEIGALGGEIAACFEVTPPPWFGEMQTYYAIGPQGSRDGDITDSKPHVAGAGMVLKKSAYLALCRRNFGFILPDRQGENLTTGGDTELCYALVLIGYRIWYDSRLKLVHFMPAARLTEAYLLKLAHGMRSFGPAVAAYEVAMNDRRPAAASFYFNRIILLGSWLGRNAVKCALGRISWLAFRISLLDWIQCWLDYPELHRSIRQGWEQIMRLKSAPQRPGSSADGPAEV